MRDRMRNCDIEVENQGSSVESRKLRLEMEKMIEQVVAGDRKVTKTGASELEDKLITVYSKVELSRSERKFLSLGPTFPLVEDLEETQADQDFLTATMKIRWQRMGMETEEVQRWKTVSGMEDEEKVEETIAMEESSSLRKDL